MSRKASIKRLLFQVQEDVGSRLPGWRVPGLKDEVRRQQEAVQLTRAGNVKGPKVIAARSRARARQASKEV